MKIHSSTACHSWHYFISISIAISLKQSDKKIHCIVFISLSSEWVQWIMHLRYMDYFPEVMIISCSSISLTNDLLAFDILDLWVLIIDERGQILYAHLFTSI